MDIRQTLAAHSYAPSPLTQQPQPADGGDIFTQAVSGFADTLAQGEAQARAAMTTGADPHSLVTALAQTELAVETAVTIRDRVVEAYQEILRMPV
ncbi:flagellar hook-basal body complex protein FliE [Gymnodinialimonas sp. 2305UL16-5]|uniref:flagellar hook-basal body complex protein FliE n=1 Tax=Gymnodinialimonas mytili TaxID=3126503 RepID=UPI0030A56BCE